jgi:hypothetical protein
MVVTFKKMWCASCQKIRNHEIVVSPCCVVCNDYNLNDIAEPICIERWS